MSFLKQNNQKLLAVFLILISLLIVYQGWFNFDIIARGDWKARSNNWISDWLNIPFAWDAGDFGGVPFLLGGRIVRYPLYFLQALLNQVFKLPYAITERIIWFFPFLGISALSIYLLTKKLFMDKTAAFLSVFIFLFNNFVLFRAHGAQMGLLTAYALCPLLILFFIKALKEKFWQNILTAGVIGALLIYYDSRVAVLCFFIISAYGFYIALVKKFSSANDYYSKIKTKRIVFSIACILLILIVLNAFWLLPLIFSGQKLELPGQNFFSLETLKMLSRTKFYHTLSLSIGDNPDFGGYVYFPGQINKTFLFFLPFLVFLPLFLSKKKKEIAFWLALYLFLAFMAKGLNPPFAWINKIFYEGVPLSSMFRLPDKFMYVMAVPFAMLYGLSGAIIVKEKKILPKFLILTIFILLPFSVIFPSVFGKNRLADTIGGSSFKSQIPDQYLVIDKWLNSTEPHFKSIFVNGTPRYDFFNFSHPRFEISTAKQNSSLFGTYYLNFINQNQNPFLNGFYYLKNIKNFDKILGLVNIKYLILPAANDPDWAWQSKDLQLANYLEIIQSNKNLNLLPVDLAKDIFIFENKNVLPKIYSPLKNMFVLGAGPGLNYLLDKQDIDIKQWNFFFSETQKNNFWQIKDYIDGFLFFQQDIDDLLLNGLTDNYKIQHKSLVNNYYLEKNLSSLGQLRLNQNLLLREQKDLGIDRIHFEKQVKKPETYDLWLRLAFFEPEKNSIELYLDHQKISSFSPSSDHPKQYKWFKIDEFDLKLGAHNFILSFSQQHAVLDQIILIPSSEYARQKKELIAFLGNKQVLFINSAGLPEKEISFSKQNGQPIEIISWHMKNPSKYEIKIKANKTGFVSFLESCDPGWAAVYKNKKVSSIPLATINNAFLIEPDFEGEEMDIYLEYRPQKYMNWGFIIFLASWTLIILSLVFLCFRDKKGRVIAFIGPDGSGKSTYIAFVKEELQKRGIDAAIYYPFNYFLLRKPLDLIKKAGLASPCPKKKNKFILFKLWPIVALFDNWLDYIFRLRKKGKTSICDRYFYDISASFSELGLAFSWLNKIYLKLIPKPDICFVCDAKEKTLRQREKNGWHKLDFFFRQRKTYLKISQKFSWPIIDSEQDLILCQEKIFNLLKKKVKISFE